ncbi:MAG: tetraacyldisaccharide 4'-kinase [Pseudomonadota bacterium]|jgi:tetraacyldisaccharide 4'-kinase
MLRRQIENVIMAPPLWLRPILYPLSLLYSLAARTHRVLYRVGILNTSTLPRPVISVGNLTVGGGGKTPVVMWLARELLERGLRPAVLTRGYGRSGKGVQVVDRASKWQNFGDEPFMMAGRLGNVPIAVSKDRYLAGSHLLKDHEVDLFILDDGFQHHALYRDLDIVVVDSLARFGNGRLIPAGVLREPVKRLASSDFIIVTRSSGPDADLEKYLNRYNPVQVMWAEYSPAGLKQVGPGKMEPLAEIPAAPMVAFCGIAQPEGFRLTLRKAGVNVAELLTFPDHHTYNGLDVERIRNTAERYNAAGLVTTEKDAVRWPADGGLLPVYELRVKLDVHNAGDLVKNILDLVSGSSEDNVK